MSNCLTRVHLHYGRVAFNYYTCFGVPKHRDNYSKHEAFEYYSCGDVFGYVRWKANQFGTQCWQVFVLQAGNETTIISKLPGITPGAMVLLALSGKARVLRFFALLKWIEANNINPPDVAPWYWIQVSARINSSIAPLPYTRKQHVSWLLERDILTKTVSEKIPCR